MKKAILFLAVATLGFSCKSKSVDADPSTACSTYSNKYLETVSAFSSNPNKKNCLAYVDALDQMLKKCTIYTAAQKSEYQKELSNARSSCNSL